MESKKPFVITIIIMSLIIVGLSAFIFMGKVQEKREKEQKTSVINDIVIDLNAFYQISDTIRRFDMAFNNVNSSYFGYIYDAKRIYANKFDMGAAVYASMFQDLITNGALMYIPEGKVRSNFKKIFGKNLEYQAAEVKNSQAYNFAYDQERQRYAYIAASESLQYPAGYIALNIKTVLSGDIIELTRKVFYGEYVGENDTATKIVMYKDASKQRKIGELSLKDGMINQSEIIAKYSSKINTYIYTFQLRKGSDYSFVKIEKGR